MAILDLPPDTWRKALGIGAGDEPSALILEGTWWHKNALTARLGKLDDVQESAFPDMFLGTRNGARVAYCCAYGAARAAEPAHVFAQMGTRLLIQIGTCGTFVPDAAPGTVILPTECAARDGVSPHYGGAESEFLDASWIARAEDKLAARKFTVRKGRHLTWPSLFAQSDAMCEAWAREGFLSVDMETSVVAAIARRFGVAALSMLSVWDMLAAGRTFLDALAESDAAALANSNEAIFDVALDLAEEAAARRAA